MCGKVLTYEYGMVFNDDMTQTNTLTTTIPCNDETFYWLEGSRAWDGTARFRLTHGTTVIFDNAPWPTVFPFMSNHLRSVTLAENTLRAVLPPA